MNEQLLVYCIIQRKVYINLAEARVLPALQHQ